MNSPVPSVPAMSDHDIHAFGPPPVAPAAGAPARTASRPRRVLWWGLAAVVLLALWLCVVVLGALIDTAPEGLQVYFDGEPVWLAEPWLGRGWVAGLAALFTVGLLLLVTALVVPLVLLVVVVVVVGSVALALGLALLAVAGTVATGLGGVVLVLALVLAPVWGLVLLLWLLLRRPRAKAPPAAARATG